MFKGVFGEAPELLVALINDLRPGLLEIAAVEVLNPGIEPEELSGKYIVLDVLALDAAGRCYDVEVVRIDLIEGRTEYFSRYEFGLIIH